jgi:hypothetical protein
MRSYKKRPCDVLLAIMLWGLEAKFLYCPAIKAKSNYDKYDNKCLRGLQKEPSHSPKSHTNNVHEPINALVSGLASWR